MDLASLKKLLPQLNAGLLQYIASETVEMDVPADTVLLKTGTYV